MTMAEQKLEKMQLIYDYVARHPHGRNSVEITAHYGAASTTVGNWIRQLCLLGYLVRMPGKRYQNGSDPDTFVIGTIGRIEALPARKKNGRMLPDDLDVRRKIIKAQQRGVAPDAKALPREFFQSKVAA